MIDVTTVAILCEITVTSLDLTTGTILAAASDHVGEHVSVRAVATQILKFPLLWSVAIAVAIRMLGIPLPPFVLSALHLLGEATSGIMLLVLGMAIKPAALIGALRRIGTWWPMLPIKLGLSPLVVAFAGVAIGLPDSIIAQRSWMQRCHLNCSSSSWRADLDSTPRCWRPRWCS